MRKYIHISALLFFVIAASVVRATPSDPRIIVSGGGDPIDVTSSVFTFMSNAAGGGVLQFDNDTQFDWLSLDFFVNLPSGSPITCSSSLYNTCDVTTTGLPGTNLAKYDIGFENPVGSGLLPGETLTIDLNDPRSQSGGWGANNTFTAEVNAPEPSSFFFLVSGILLLGGLRFYSRRIYL